MTEPEHQQSGTMSQQIDPKLAAQYESRAPGWVVRCKRCGFTEPWGKYAIRIGAASKGKVNFRRCRRCNRFGCHAITKRGSDEP